MYHILMRFEKYLDKMQKYIQINYEYDTCFSFSTYTNKIIHNIQNFMAEAKIKIKIIPCALCVTAGSSVPWYF